MLDMLDMLDITTLADKWPLSADRCALAASVPNTERLNPAFAEQSWPSYKTLSGSAAVTRLVPLALPRLRGCERAMY